MRILVTGATGFIGRALIPRLYRDGHTVTAWVRSEASARAMLGADVETAPSGLGAEGLVAALARCEAVVNLAGEPLMGGRWTEARRVALVQSRVQATDDLVRALAAASPRPRVLISGSAVGYYGDRADQWLTEASGPGQDFLAQLCVKWEQAAHGAQALGLRVVRLRTGVVLGRAGGALAQLLPPFQLGLGGPVGAGTQYLPWIHLHDFVTIVAAALADDHYEGAVNAVAPEPVTSRQFGQALGRVLHRPAVVPLPALVLKAIFGEAATVLLASQRVEPRVLAQRAFGFEYPTVSGALADILGGTPVSISPASSPPAGAEGARYELRTRTIVDAPVAETFVFFSKAANLGIMTPAGMRFRIEGRVPPMAVGARIDYRIRVGPVSVGWHTRIAHWEPGRRFVDVQEAGPYRLWWHEHTFDADGTRTIMEDRVYYTPPLGVLGRVVHGLCIGPMLRRIFSTAET